MPPDDLEARRLADIEESNRQSRERKARATGYLRAVVSGPDPEGKWHGRAPRGNGAGLASAYYSTKDEFGAAAAAADAQREERQAFLPAGDNWQLDASGRWPADIYTMKESACLAWCEAVQRMIKAEALRRGADPKLDENDLDLSLGDHPADLIGWLGDLAEKIDLKERIGPERQPFEIERTQGKEQGKAEAAVPVKIYTYDEMLALPEACFLVDGVLVYRGKNVIFGVSNTFKSFHAVDLGCSVSTGRSYHGKAVRKMKVFYAANEGAIGIGRKRIAAWMAYHGIPQAERHNIFLIRDETIIPDPASRGNLIAGIRQYVEPGEDFFTIFDIHRGTMNAPDKDDDAADAWIKGAEILIKEGGTTLSIAHSPYSDDARARGSSHQWGSWDGRIQSEGDKEKRTSVLKVDRFKDHESTGQWGFTLDEQEIEEHPGEFSLVPRLDGTVKPKTRGPSPKQKSLLVEVIERAIDEAWTMITPDADGPPIKAAPDHIVRNRYYLRQGWAETDDKKEKATRARAFNRPLKEMIDRKEVLAHPINGERHLWIP